MIERFLIVWLVLVSAVAYQDLPPEWDLFLQSKPYLPALIMATMFAIGAILPRDEVTQVLKRWPSVIGGTCVQYTAMPILAYALAELFQLSPAYKIGMIMVGCVPGAMASNVFTLLARGNVSYSVSLTTTATLLSPLAVPFILSLIFSGVQAGPSFSEKLIDLLVTVVSPVVLGHVFARHDPGFRSLMEKCGANVAHLTILWIIAVVVALNRDRLAYGASLILLPLLLLNGLGYLAGYFGGGMLRLDAGMRRALTLEVGMQNAGLGTVMAAQWYADQPEATIPTAMYTFGCALTGTMLAHWWRGRGSAEDGTAKAPR